MRFRLGEADRDEYELGHEWYELDLRLSGLDDLSWQELDDIEQEIGPLLDVDRRSVRGLRLVAWMARRAAGVTERFRDFRPRVFAFEYDRDVREAAPAADADPPSGSDSSGRVGSVTRSAGSTRRSRGSTTSRRAKSGS